MICWYSTERRRQCVRSTIKELSDRKSESPATVMYIHALCCHEFNAIIDFILFQTTKGSIELRMSRYRKKDRVVYPICSRFHINQSHTSSLNVKRRFVQDLPNDWIYNTNANSRETAVQVDQNTYSTSMYIASLAAVSLSKPI